MEKPCGRRRHHPVNAHRRADRRSSITWGEAVGGRQTADLAELADLWKDSARRHYTSHATNGNYHVSRSVGYDSDLEVYEG